MDSDALLRVKPGGEQEFDALQRHNEYLVAMLAWMENQLPAGCEIVVTESFRTYEQYKKIYPKRGKEQYRKNKHAQLLAVDIKIDTKKGSSCKCKKTNKDLVPLAKKAGFKGIGTYNAHIHIDMRKNPASWTGKSK